MRKEPARPELIKRILNEVKKNPNGIWIRKISRNLNEPLATIYKYILREDYCGKYIITKKSPQELGGHLMVKTRGRHV